jgi:hypothetical protein
MAEKIVAVVAGGAVEDEHSAGAANRRWGLGDELFGEVEMEVACAHVRSFFVVQITVSYTVLTVA